MSDQSTDAQRASGRSVFVVFGSVVAIILAVLIGVLITEEDPTSTESDESGLPVIGTVPDGATFTERSGRTIQLGDLNGSPWIASFIFTRCRGICPVLSRSLSKLQDDLRDMHQVRMISFTVDPEHDTPEVLREYADQYNADPERWLFLRADSAAMQRLAHETFHVAIAEGMDEEEPILHSSKFFIVDSQGDVRAFFDGRTDKGLQQLKATLRSMLRDGN